MYRKGMLDKRALLAIPSMTDTINALGSLGALASSYLVASAVIGGAGLGWTAAKITSHGKQEESTAQKDYENRRLRSDINYLGGRLAEEYRAKKGGSQQQAARLVNI